AGRAARRARGPRATAFPGRATAEHGAHGGLRVGSGARGPARGAGGHRRRGFVSTPREWRVERTADGSPTLVHPDHGEACHSAHGAWSEAWGRHVLACDLPGRLARGSALRLLDVGTGPGLSLAAAFLAAEQHDAPLLVTTLEIDPRAPRAALE